MCAEMVSANALKFSNAKSLKMLKTNEHEHPLSMQVFGGDAQAVADACVMAQQMGADIVDINAGCPVKKVNKAGAGCILMKEPQKVEAMIKAAVKAVKIPVTLKTRIGLKHGEVLGPLLAKIAQDAGASAVTIHARFAVDYHNGAPDLKALEECCKSVTIPVIGNGGAVDEKTALDIFNTGAAAVMIGRGAIGNPFIFRDIAAVLSGGQKQPLTLKERLTMYKQLVEENVLFYGERTGVSRSKKTVGYWIRDFNGSSSVREQLVRSESLQQVAEIISPLINNNL